MKSLLSLLMRPVMTPVKSAFLAKALAAGPCTPLMPTKDLAEAKKFSAACCWFTTAIRFWLCVFGPRDYLPELLRKLPRVVKDFRPPL